MVENMKNRGGGGVSIVMMALISVSAFAEPPQF